MKTLLLGGTAFVGRHLVDEARSQGHEVTVFTRGKAPAGVPAGVEHIVGDRETDLGLLAGREFDVVIDTSGYVPDVVSRSAGLLAGSVERYVFVSTISVYESAPLVDEQTPTRRLAEGAAQDPNEAYGELKALCEQAVEAALPGRSLVLRPGLIVGRYDYTDRFSYWPWRIARGGEVLAPVKPASPVRLIDVRDLAEWTIRLVEERATGVYTAAGPAEPIELGMLLEECRTVSGSDARFTWVGEEFLLAHDVAPYTELPLWIPSHDGGSTVLDVSKALAAGLTFRPVAETISDILDWRPGPDAEQAPSFGLTRPTAGLSPERERSLLAAWHKRSGG